MTHKTYRLFSIISIIISFCFTANSQESHLKQKLSDNVSIWGIDTEQNDSIYFLRISKGSTLDPKPTLIFIQGSLPIPSVIKLEDGYFMPFMNFDYSIIAEKYNIIVISKPFTPTIATLDQLTDQYCYVPDVAFPKEYDTLYLKNNYREKYISRTNDVIEYLQTKKWVDNDEISIVGHSEGASVAIGVALSNNAVKAVGYLSGNPMGRYAQYINSQRDAEKRGLQTPEESQEAISSLYEQWSKISLTPEGLAIGDPKKTWMTFSKPIIDEIVSLKCHLFIGYGTADLGGQFCDYMPIYLDLAQKTDYKFSPYVGRGHNFEKMVGGKPDFDDMIWDKVLNDFLGWLESL